MKIKKAIHQLRLISTDRKCQPDTPVVVAVEMEDKSVTYKEAKTVALKRVTLVDHDKPIYAIVYT